MNRLIKPQTLDDIVFEGRNKTYGAYALRREYPRTLMRSMLITLTACTLFTGLLIAMRKAPAPVKPPEEGVFKFTNVEVEIPPIAQLLPPKAPAPPVEPKVAVLENTYQVVEQVPEVTAPAELPNPSPAVPGVGGGEGGTETFTAPVLAALPAAPIEAAQADQPPVFPGGLEKFYEYLRKHIVYNALAREAGAKGRVYATFVIGRDGLPREVSILKGIGFGLDEQVLTVLKRSPAWQPALLHGEPVATIFRIPVHFDLSK